MKRLLPALASAGILAAASAHAASLNGGTYAATGMVESNNGNVNCAELNLLPGEGNNANFVLPKAGAKGFVLYVPFRGGTEEICDKFAPLPESGLNGYTSNATCTVKSLSGNYPPAAGVSFAFTATLIDRNSAIGTMTMTIPNLNGVPGAGCQAFLAMTFVRSGQ